MNSWSLYALFSLSLYLMTDFGKVFSGRDQVVRPIGQTVVGDNTEDSDVCQEGAHPHRHRPEDHREGGEVRTEWRYPRRLGKDRIEVPQGIPKHVKGSWKNNFYLAPCNEVHKEHGDCNQGSFSLELGWIVCCNIMREEHIQIVRVIAIRLREVVTTDRSLQYFFKEENEGISRNYGETGVQRKSRCLIACSQNVFESCKINMNIFCIYSFSISP